MLFRSHVAGARLLRSFLLAGFACGLAAAQESKQLKRCLDKAKDQLQMRMCASDDLGRAKAAMNSLYQKLVATLPPAPAKRVEAAQKAWVAYRDAVVDAYCEEASIGQACGTLYFTTALLVDARLTWRHVDELELVLKEHSEH